MIIAFDVKILSKHSLGQMLIYCALRVIVLDIYRPENNALNNPCRPNLRR